MTFNNPWLVGLAAVAAIQAVMIGNMLRQKAADNKAATTKVAPYKLEPIANSKLLRVTLTPKAAERLGIKTATMPGAGARVADATGGTPTGTATELRNVPYAALLYDLDGSTWIYKEVGPLTYERHQIKVNSIAGDSVLISDGLAPGTAVVSQGAIELFGTETKVGH